MYFLLGFDFKSCDIVPNTMTQRNLSVFFSLTLVFTKREREWVRLSARAVRKPLCFTLFRDWDRPNSSFAPVIGSIRRERGLFWEHNSVNMSLPISIKLVMLSTSFIVGIITDALVHTRASTSMSLQTSFRCFRDRYRWSRSSGIALLMHTV